MTTHGNNQPSARSALTAPEQERRTPSAPRRRCHNRTSDRGRAVRACRPSAPSLEECKRRGSFLVRVCRRFDTVEDCHAKAFENSSLRPNQLTLLAYTRHRVQCGSKEITEALIVDATLSHHPRFSRRQSILLIRQHQRV